MRKQREPSLGRPRVAGRLLFANYRSGFDAVKNRGFRWSLSRTWSRPTALNAAAEWTPGESPRRECGQASGSTKRITRPLPTKRFFRVHLIRRRSQMSRCNLEQTPKKEFRLLRDLKASAGSVCIILIHMYHFATHKKIGEAPKTWSASPVSRLLRERVSHGSPGVKAGFCMS